MNRIVGDYELLDLLGTGGMGEVYRARDRRHDRLVAIKRIRPEVGERTAETTSREGTGAQARRRLHREAELVSGLEHPNIVKLYDITFEDDDEWIVMELIDGRTLRRLLREGPLPAAEAVALGQQIAAGLAEAHENGIVHRDLKTENILVTRDGQVKIVDFGLAKRVGRSAGDKTLTGVQSVMGTFRAMSPEQVRGEPLDPRSDLFALGSLLYETACGRAPFAHPNDLQTMHLILTERQMPAQTLNPDVPEELSNLIDQMLEKDPNLRPRSARDVERALAGLNGESPGRPLGEETLLDGLP
ncbi:MAG: serine/threonine-protein kinase [Acidobacteriota bacterium]